MRTITQTITLTSAQKEFDSAIEIGHYVGWWISADGQNSMALCYAATAAACIAEAAKMNDDDYYKAPNTEKTLFDSGDLVINLVVADEVNDE